MVYINRITLFLVVLAVLYSFLVLNTFEADNTIIATKNHVNFSKNDFTIKDFGIDNDGNPFLTVEGKAGASIPKKENTGYAYVFVTNNGIFSVSSDWMYTKWHTHELKLDEKNCVESMNMNAGAGAEVSDTVKVTKTNATKLDKVITAEFTISNEDGSVCATKIFDSAP
jgi:hypothetical protein